MDSTKPTDIESVLTFPGYIREVKKKVVELESSFFQHITGFPVYNPIEITAGLHDIAVEETFIKANAGIQEQNFTVDPAVLLPGVPYVLKKTDATANVVHLSAKAGTFINDTEVQVTITLQYEVLRFISDGVGVQTC